MDKQSIDEISAAVELIANRYPHIQLCVVMAQPCTAHNGEHLDVASCGTEDLCALVYAAICAFKGVSPNRTELN